MRADVVVNTIETHTAGMPSRIALDGFDESKLGRGSVAEKRDAFEREFEWLRELTDSFLVNNSE